MYRSALGPSRSPGGPAGGGSGGGAAGGFPGVGMVDGGFFGAQASAATRAAVTIARRIVRLFLGFSTSENGDHLGLFTRDLEQLPSPFAHVGPPADELFPLLGGGPEDTQVGDVLPVGRIRSWLRGHRGGSGETISRVLFTRWYEQMVISLGWLSPAISCGLPAAQTTRAGSRCLFGLAPTGGCRAAPVARRAVGSYPTVSPLPFGYKGGLFSVALFRRLAAPRRYLAVCPVELGLSSMDPSSRSTATIGPTTSRAGNYRAAGSPGKAYLVKRRIRRPKLSVAARPAPPASSQKPSFSLNTVARTRGSRGSSCVAESAKICRSR